MEKVAFRLSMIRYQFGELTIESSVDFCIDIIDKHKITYDKIFILLHKTRSILYRLWNLYCQGERFCIYTYDQVADDDGG